MHHFLACKAVLGYIENRVTEDLTGNELAAVAGLSLAHFREVFKKATGQTLSRYIMHRRLCHAAAELAHSNREVAVIAMDYNFASHDVFIRAFKRHFYETPSDFRKNKRLVHGTLIVPGIFGPAVQAKENLVMTDDRNDTIENDLSQGTLFGVVPKVFYNEKECTPFPSCLRACLTYLGQETNYTKLMVASGAAFRLRWNLNMWDGGNVDIRCLTTDPTEPLRRACWAMGRDFRLLCKPGKDGQYMAENATKNDSRILTGDKNDFISLVVQEINAGRPLIGFGIIGPPEACIIAGYRDNGETLVGWNFFQDMPEYAGSISKEPCGYFRRSGWFEDPMTVALMSIGPLGTLPTEREFLQETLRYALTLMQTNQVLTYAGGDAAYAAWAQALLNEEEFPARAPLPLLMERLMCQTDAMTMVGEGRAYAAAFMEQAAVAFPEVGTALQEAAKCFRTEYKLVMDMCHKLEGFSMSEKQARNLAKPEIRHCLVDLINKCAAADHMAAQHLQEALNGLL